jgi:hypothetical protein
MEQEEMKKTVLNFYCKHDGNPMWVSLHPEANGVAFGINDDDNDERRQVVLSISDARKLADAINAYLQKIR